MRIWECPFVMVKNKELEEKSMNSIALGAENTKKRALFLSVKHMLESIQFRDYIDATAFRYGG